MQYEDAVKVWGATKLHACRFEGAAPNPATVTVRFDFSEGYACCGGSDPNCYCSFAESPKAEIVIEAQCSSGKHGMYATIGANDFDLGRVVRELVEAGEGTISL